VATNAAHAGSFFVLLRQFGSVGAALMKALQTLLVVVLSAALFCGADRLQCLNAEKALSVGMVVLGFSIYGGPGGRRDSDAKQ
jgi:hypothetical protein